MMIALIAITLAGAAPAGQAPTPTTAATGVTAKADAAKLFCRREVPVGSIMPGKRLCLTAAQWKQVGDAREAMADGFYHRPIRGVDNKPDL